MCLYVKTESKAKVAEDDIVVYKLLVDRSFVEARLAKSVASSYPLKRQVEEYTAVLDSSDSKKFTPYKLAPVDTSINMKSRLISEPAYAGDIGDRVNIGVHSFGELEDAQTIQKEFNFYYSAVASEFNLPAELPAKVYKCVIPKGASYFEGRFTLTSSIWKDAPSFASTELKFIEQIE